MAVTTFDFIKKPKDMSPEQHKLMDTMAKACIFVDGSATIGEPTETKMTVYEFIDSPMIKLADQWKNSTDDTVLKLSSYADDGLLLYGNLLMDMKPVRFEHRSVITQIENDETAELVVLDIWCSCTLKDLTNLSLDILGKNRLKDYIITDFFIGDNRLDCSFNIMIIDKVSRKFSTEIRKFKALNLAVDFLVSQIENDPAIHTVYIDRQHYGAVLCDNIQKSLSQGPKSSYSTKIVPIIKTKQI